MERNRFQYVGLALMVIVTGLASRRYAAKLPEFAATYAGDTLWALMVFLLLGAVLRKVPTRRIALIAIAIAWADEFSQLYHAPLLDGLRRTMLGALVLGQGFVWSDLACYAVGVGIGAGGEYLVRRRKAMASEVGLIR